MEYGIGQAKRGWAEKSDIINTNSIDELLKYFKK
jgi:histidinol phosphatase-like PHP family hydrolase